MSGDGAANGGTGGNQVRTRRGFRILHANSAKGVPPTSVHVIISAYLLSFFFLLLCSYILSIGKVEKIEARIKESVVREGRE